MPTYEYHCPACGATYDLRQSFSAETTHVCEQCGKGTAKRVLHAPPVVFKGSGWYSTDHRSGKAGTSHSESHDDSGSEAAASSSDSNTKTETSSTTSKEPASKGDSAAAAAS